ncbi:site-specific DNA-methyltransferase [Helicobacter sp. MIT 11-5569]|uniref:site-specific DNA-methyltransferase n=1 Tax=Helicobacter sp. MIT 11-5569 TaxID=1548151 RepID=UPI0010FF11A3|nr:site-specific DNA-methyltransferase [Helicobacter sp. MIT 11-5569]TLD83996.1 site-specific DNA-methyltransferase [Helicobacter sp. MIT 11-5569]
MNYKQAFYSKLEDCYMGVKIKDFHKNNIAKSGFSNLLHIKEKYFQHIKAYLDSQVEKEPLSHDIYNKLYTFFDSYLNESGTPFFSDTPIYKNIYAKVYSNSKDTSLFYKTQNLYYVKSDTLYQSLLLSDEKQNYEVYFDASEYRQNADNNKNKVLFKFQSISQEDQTPRIIIKVLSQKDLFPELNNVFKQNSNEFSEEFLKDLRQNAILKDFKIKINEEELKKIFKSYKKQSEIDFFIHKNAKAFLQEQFDLWMFGYLYKDSEIQEWNPHIIAHLQKIKNIAYEIIKLIADFENELKAIWLKPKFAKKVEYVFSVDMILNQIARSANLKGVVGVGGEFERGEGATSQFKPLSSLIKEFLELILNDKGFESQVKEWRELNLIDENFDKQDFLDFCCSKSLAGESKNNKYYFLPIDTKHFSQTTKYKILNSFDNLESILNGELIKADNFQALNTLMPKYSGKVDLIYIDPPYNTGNDGFIYADTFNHASWLSMINNRLECAKELLNQKGSIFISIDDKEQARLKLLCDEMFGEENFVANFVWEKKGGRQNDAQWYSVNHEYVVNYAKIKESFKPNLLQRTEDMLESYKNPDNDPRGVWTSITLQAKSGNESMRYKIVFPNGIEWEAPMGSYPRFSKDKMLELYEDNRIWFGENKKNTPRLKKFLLEVKEGVVHNTLLTQQEVGNTQQGKQDIKDNFENISFDTPKPEKLLQRILEIASNKQDSIILDFFAGSGTTCAVAQKLGRKWLGVEMGEHFYNVIIPRLKKVIAGFVSGIFKECDYKGGGAFRYYELESYEEALTNCEYVLQPLIFNTQENKSNYKGKDYAKAGKIIDYNKSRKLIDKLNKGETICLDMTAESRKDFDIFHTLANLMGWKIKRLFVDSKDIESCEFDNGEIIAKDCLDLAKYPKLKNLIWWE